MSRLQRKYNESIKKELFALFGYKNVMQIPKVLKIIIGMGLGEAVKDKTIIQDAQKELALISGQKPMITRAKKSISNFKLREGQAIGLKVTLRGIRMYEFMDRFFNIICPRIRDFRGFSTNCDGKGNYNLGLIDHQIYPELDLDKVKKKGVVFTLVQ